MAEELRTLREQVDKEGPLPVRDAVGWLTRAAKTVAFIHQQQRVHGALSADAIFITETDCEAEGSLGHPADLPEVREFHSMDRCKYGDLSVSDDVWALSVTLFYCVTGVMPFPRGVESWVEAGNRQPPPAAMYGGDLSGMDSVLGLLLDPGIAPEDTLTANMLVAQLAVFSPMTMELMPLQLQTPRDGQLDMSATLERMPHILAGIPEVGDDGVSEPPLPNQALLASLPPRPITSRSPAALSSIPRPPKLTGWKTKLNWMIVGGALALGIAIGIGAMWLLMSG
ncbi:MAG: hypothetical protein JRI23_32475 [Deltaproteobacteria bacterium]|nr:hypothetical protein [Deltaproteobacteria bacterium]